MLTWYSPTIGERDSPLPLPGLLAFTAHGCRSCTGIWSSGRRIPCPQRTAIPAGQGRSMCAACTTVDRRHSVAADTAFDDPRPFRLYLAWFGPGLPKIGITAAERGNRRLLEQGALAHTWLGEGPLAAVRRAEIALGTALDIPDRVSSARKRNARTSTATPEQAGEDLAVLRRLVHDSTAWPATLDRLPLHVEAHHQAYRLDLAAPPAPTADVSELTPGCTVAGAVDTLVGSDAYLTTDRGPLLLSLRLIAGWPLTRAADEAATTVPARPLHPLEKAQDALF